MDEARDNTIRPRQVTIAVRLILVSALTVLLASLVRDWGSGDAVARLLRLSLPEAAFWSILAWRIARGRNWARVAFTTFALLELFSIVIVRELTAAFILGALGAGLRISAVFFLYTPAAQTVFRPREGFERRWVFPLTLAVVLAAQLVLLLTVCYLVATDAATGEWHRSLGSILLDLISLAIAIAFCLTPHSLRRLIAKVAVVLVALSTPLTARALLPISEPWVAYHRERDRHRDFKSFMKAWRAEHEFYEKLHDWQEGRGPFPELPQPAEPPRSNDPGRKLSHVHTEELKALFQSEQRVVAVGERFLILDNGHCVVIYGIDVAPRQTSAFKAFADENIVGKTVDVRLPEHHENLYIPGREGRRWSGVEYGEPTDGRGRLYGEVQGLVFFNGHLLNLDYCRPQSRDTFLEYQQEYERGEL